ncbi:hypothetical protein FTUN_8963 [Frigoriglobus tundricola]|uniref:Uncharacterized protein n=1 Tax=Frigoriglobus tundricola TaxID=2774151 RepID=A0A6M5Z507_9BACT|nr:hypothetical protein FTUN_8963 [Frigoriglobus tundricola]
MRGPAGELGDEGRLAHPAARRRAARAGARGGAGRGPGRRTGGRTAGRRRTGSRRPPPPGARAR